MVHSSSVPNDWNNCLTSSSVCCLLSIPTNSLRSSVIETTQVISRWPQGAKKQGFDRNWSADGVGRRKLSSVTRTSCEGCGVSSRFLASFARFAPPIEGWEEMRGATNART